VVVTELTIGEETWPIQITLTNRENMRFKMLLGREAMREKLVVNPSVEYLHGKRSHKSMMSIYGCPYIPRTES
jgi:ribosomal protein S6--L-glutamate ligase